jgi:putative thioredoxin
MTLPPNFSQAVDLSSLGKPAPAPLAEVPGVQVTPQNLQSELLPLSERKPVVILCWSPRSQESIEILKDLGELESADKGTWQLAQVNVEEEVQVAQALQVRSIPFGVVFIAGQVIPFLDKAINKSQLREVITKILTLASQQGVGAEPIEETEPEEEEALAALEKGDYLAAEGAYRKLLARKPNDQYAKLGLAQVLLLARTHGVDAALTMEKALESPEDLALQMRCADVEVMSGYLEPAFERLLRLIAVLHEEEQKMVKDHLLELFSLVDPADPRVIKARTQLANALF